MAGTLPVGEEKTAFVREMFDTIAPRYRLVNDLMTLGLDRGWRRATVRRLLLPPRATVLDLASGTGDLLAALERADMRAVGADLSYGMLTAARHRGSLVQADAASLAFSDDSFDGMVCGFALRNFTDLAAVLVEAARVVRRGGRISLLEVDNPDIPGLRMGHRLWMSRVVPAIGGLVSDASAYRYLPRSLAYLPSPDELATMLRTAGFERVARHRLSGGIVQIVTATRAGAPPIPVAAPRRPQT